MGPLEDGWLVSQNVKERNYTEHIDEEDPRYYEDRTNEFPLPVSRVRKYPGKEDQYGIDSITPLLDINGACRGCYEGWTQSRRRKVCPLCSCNCIFKKRLDKIALS